MESQVSLHSWDEVWERARNAGFTHYNYSHGKKRFRGILEEPDEIGQDPILPDKAPIRIRFYQIINDEYVENEDLDCWLKPPKDSGLEVPDTFDEWGEKQQKKYIDVAMQRLSAGRFSKQMESHDKLLFRFIDHLSRQVDKKEKLIGELYDKVNELSSSRGISNIWEFLVHPNAYQIVQTIVAAVNAGRGLTPEVVGEAKRLAGQ